jgi:hypothetical protein
MGGCDISASLVEEHGSLSFSEAALHVTVLQRYEYTGCTERLYYNFPCLRSVSVGFNRR